MAPLEGEIRILGLKRDEGGFREFSVDSMDRLDLNQINVRLLNAGQSAYVSSPEIQPETTVVRFDSNGNAEKTTTYHTRRPLVEQLLPNQKLEIKNGTFELKARNTTE